MFLLGLTSNDVVSIIEKMKKLYLIIPILFIVSCSEQTVYFSGSVGIYPDRIFWAFLEYPPPDFGIVDNATVLLDSTTRIPFSGEKNGYYREGVIGLTYKSLHTIQVEVEDKENIFGTVEIPSSFEINAPNSIGEGDSLVIRWTHVDEMNTPPEEWRMIVIMGGDTLHYLGFAITEEEYKIHSGIIDEDIEIIMDAIRMGELSGAYENSAFAGLVRKRKNVTVN